MASDVVLALVLQTAIVVAALAGLVRVAALRAYADDARLRRLATFFGLLAGAVGAEVLVSAFLLGQASAGGAPVPHALFALVLAHHALMLAALVVALRTFAVPWSAAAAAPAVLIAGHANHFAYFGLAEALLTLYLAVTGFANLGRRRTPAALRVALAFALVFLGHALFFVFLHHGGPRPFAGEALTLAGVWLLAAAVPRRTA